MTSTDSDILRQAVSWKALGGNDPVDEVASVSSTDAPPQVQQHAETEPLLLEPKRRSTRIPTLSEEDVIPDQTNTVQSQSEPQKKTKTDSTTTERKPKSTKGKKKKKKRNIDQEDENESESGIHDKEEEEKSFSSSSKKSKRTRETKPKTKNKKKKDRDAAESSKSISSKSSKKTASSSSSKKKKTDGSKSSSKSKKEKKKKKKTGKDIVVGVMKKSSSMTRLAPSNSSLLENAKFDVVDTINDIDDPDVLYFCKSLGLKRITIPTTSTTKSKENTGKSGCGGGGAGGGGGDSSTRMSNNNDGGSGEYRNARSTVKTLCCVRHPNQVITTSALLEWEQYESVDVCKICSSEHQALHSLVEELDPVDGSSVPPITYFRRNQIHQRKSMAVCIQQIQDLQKDKELWKKRYLLASTIDEDVDDDENDDDLVFSSIIDEMYGVGGSSSSSSSHVINERSNIQEEVEIEVGEVEWLNQLGERALQVQQWSYDDKLKDQSSSEYDKYYKMISVGVPLLAVKTTITQDGLDPDGLSEELLKPSSFFRRTFGGGGDDDHDDDDVGIIVDRLHKTFHRRKAKQLLAAVNVLAKEQDKIKQKQQKQNSKSIKQKMEKKPEGHNEYPDDNEDYKKPGSWWKLQSQASDDDNFSNSDENRASPSDGSKLAIQELKKELEQKNNIIQSLQERISSLERELADWQGGGYTPVSTTAASTDSSDVDDEIPISDRLLVAHQPKQSDDSIDHVSLAEEELFDELPIKSDDEIKKKKPLLAAALKAKEERLSKSFSHFDLSGHGKENNADVTGDLSNSVPQHLISMNQPKLARSASFDTASLDEDELFEQPQTSSAKPSLLAAALKAKSEKDTPKHLRDVNQPTRSTSFESTSLNEDELFDERSAQDMKVKKPLLAAARKARSEADSRRTVRVRSIASLTLEDDPHLDETFKIRNVSASPIPISVEPLVAERLKAEGVVSDHLKDLNQPTVHKSLESNSLDTENIFEDRPIDSKVVSKPLLAAALKAKAEEDIPVHLREIHQPQRTRSVDSLSLDNEEIFDQPPSTPPSAKPLLEAAQKAKLELSERSEVVITIGSLSDESSEYEEVEEVYVPEHLLVRLLLMFDFLRLSGHYRDRQAHNCVLLHNNSRPCTQNLNQPQQTISEDGSSLDDDDLFDTSTRKGPCPDRPLLSAALQAKEQQEMGINNPTDLQATNDTTKQIHRQYDAVVPAHLLTAHQPTTESSYEEYSIDEDELFDEPSHQRPSPRKPLLAAALKARESYMTPDIATDGSGEEVTKIEEKDVVDPTGVDPDDGRSEYEEYEISIDDAAETSSHDSSDDEFVVRGVNSSDDYTEVTVEED